MSTEAKKAAVKLREEMVRTGLWPCCLNCEHWREKTTISGTAITVSHGCTKYNTRPPDTIIVVGCAHHLQTIPF